MIIVYNETLDGHRLEYCHHLYIHACKDIDNKYIFTIPEKDKERLSKMKWDTCKHVSFLYLSNKHSSNWLKRSWDFVWSIKKIIDHYHPSRLVLLDLMICLPFLPLIRSKTKISGIIYGIYLYTWKKDSFLKRISDVIKFKMFTWSKSLDSVFIQSDAIGARYLNIKYKSRKFKYLCDPVVLINEISPVNIREKLGIPNYKTIVLHAGGLQRRKGTLELLQAIGMMNQDNLDRYCFVFAGKVTKPIYTDYYRLVNELKDQVMIKTLDDFLDFDYLGALFNASDLVVIPYLVTNQSSGIVGYSAEFKKPVVVTEDGLLGNIVKKYKLGPLIKNSSPKTICDFLCNFTYWEFVPNTYLADNTVKEFCNTLLYT